MTESLIDESDITIDDNTEILGTRRIIILCDSEKIANKQVKEILENQEKAEKYDKWFKNNTLLGTALQEAIKTKHQNRILKSGLEKLLKSWELTARKDIDPITLLEASELYHELKEVLEKT